MGYKILLLAVFTRVRLNADSQLQRRNTRPAVPSSLLSYSLRGAVYVRGRRTSLRGDDYLGAGRARGAVTGIVCFVADGPLAAGDSRHAENYGLCAASPLSFAGEAALTFGSLNRVAPSRLSKSQVWESLIGRTILEIHIFSPVRVRDVLF